MKVLKIEPFMRKKEQEAMKMKREKKSWVYVVCMEHEEERDIFLFFLKLISYRPVYGLLYTLITKQG